MAKQTASKVILIICDGLGDRPIADLGDLTPLEAARTPNLDRLAKEGITGMMWTLGRGQAPGSDIAHLSILGYDLHEHYAGRGPIEVRGLDMKLKPGDLALRGNLGTVDPAGKIIDRRAGRIEATGPFVKELDGLTIDNTTFTLKPGTAHRVGIVMSGPDLSAEITDSDPHAENATITDPKPKVDTPEAKRTARVLTQFLAQARSHLERHSLNVERVKAGKLPANYLLVRGAGYYKNVPAFHERYGLKAACVAGAGLYKGIGAYTGMDVVPVPGATGVVGTDVRAKFTKAKELLSSHDFVFVHVKPTDSLAEDGNFLGKKQFIEQIDAAAEEFLGLDDVLLVLTADHSTPSALRHHSSDPVPVLVHGPGVRPDRVTEFGERTCSAGGIGWLRGPDLMPEVINWLGRAKLHGS
jgi:2,3-bisphosphoglycerate-independent phosphoglycerate mutase